MHLYRATMNVVARYVTVAEAAAELGVPATWLRQQIKAGRLPHVQAGRLIRCNPAAIAEAVDAIAANATAASGAKEEVRHA